MIGRVNNLNTVSPVINSGGIGIWNYTIYQPSDLLLNLTNRIGNDMIAAVGSNTKIATPTFYCNSSAYYSLPGAINIGKSHEIYFEVNTNMGNICTNGSTSYIGVGLNSVNYRCSSASHNITVTMPLGFHRIRIVRVEKEIDVYIDDQAPVHYTLTDLHNVDFLFINLGRVATLTATGYFPRFTCTGHDWVLTGETTINDRVGTTNATIINGVAANKGYYGYGSTEFLDIGFSRYVHATLPDIDIPYKVDGNPFTAPVVPGGYTLEANYPGIAGKHNLVHSKIKFTDAFFDRSNIVIWKDEARLGYYDAVNPMDFHPSELNLYTLSLWLNTGYAGRVFPIFTNESMVDRISLNGLLMYATDKTLDNERYVLMYTGDIARAVVDPVGNIVYDDTTGYILLN